MEEESGGGLVKEEGTNAELEVEMSPGIGRGAGRGGHEGFPGNGGGEMVNEGSVGAVAQPRTPCPAPIEPPRELVAPAVLP